VLLNEEFIVFALFLKKDTEKVFTSGDIEAPVKE